MKKICSKKECLFAGEEQDITEFNRKHNKYVSQCKSCCKEYMKTYNNKYYIINSKKLTNYQKEYRLNNSEKISEKAAKYYLDNKESILENRKEYEKLNYNKIRIKQKLYYINNKEKIIKKNYSYKLKKLANDPNFKFRETFSSLFRTYLKNISVIKNNSCFNILGYSINELQNHLESLFEPWMNWNNHGAYSIESWKDDDQSTWTWQIDHIIPHSEFFYISIEDPILRTCWALSNLRPLSAKQNLLDGASKIRHLK